MRVYPGSHSLHPPHPAAALAADWDTLWLFLLPRNDGLVWRLNASLQTVGWELTTATWGGYGRKVRQGGGYLDGTGGSSGSEAIRFPLLPSHNSLPSPTIT